MKNIRASIEILFRNICPDKMIENYLSDFPKGIGQYDFSQQAFDLLGYYSHDEINNLYALLKDDWAKDNYKDLSSVFNLVNKFSSCVLTEHEGTPKVKFEHLLRWREISHKLGEDFFTCNYLAFKDLKFLSERDFFAWRPIIDSDNARLKTLLSKGLAENHFHLFGSAPYCELSWISLMNDITSRLPQFKKIFKKGMLQQSDQIRETTNYKLYFLTLKAAVIRAYLFYVIHFHKPLLFNSKISINELLKGHSEKDECEFLASQILNIQKEINILRYEFGLKYENNYVVDYAIGKSNSKYIDNANILLSGERWFLYTISRSLGKGTDFETIFIDNKLFYIYLLCKNRFREEMVQINNKTGFYNFSSYQDRKDIFLIKKRVYTKALTNMAIQTSNSNQNILSFEARISHKNIFDILKIDESIANKKNYNLISAPINNNINNRKDPNHFYVVHFLKKLCNNPENRLVSMLQPRDYELRKKVKKQALNLYYLRESGSKLISSRIHGIDAASNEIYARPEVFSSAFRFLKQYQSRYSNHDLMHYLNLKPLSPLHSTFHVGEDFLDLVDGLRAIDEAIKFLELSDGDRIGHALALGINVEDYYDFKNYKLLLPCQNVLDNYSWMLSRIIKYGLNEFMALKSVIEHEFRVLFSKIYDGLSLKVDPVLYYQAWTLRGDDPILYKNGIYNFNEYPITDYDHFLKGKYGNDVYRKKEDIIDILFAYHYNSDVKIKGSEIMQINIKNEYIRAVEVIQKKMQNELAEKHIAIECNPSSNVLISTFKRYDKHPLMRFYNLGLTSDSKEIQDCPQLMISINTDDQGVFNTYLENEYAFMAKALEKVKDKNGKPIYNISMIYDWLERIRQMGIEMSFKTNIKM
jgi:hypothetical protein